MSELLIYLIFAVILLIPAVLIQILTMIDRLENAYFVNFNLLLNLYYQKIQKNSIPVLNGNIDTESGLQELSAEYVRSILNRKRRINTECLKTDKYLQE